jgi:hypothetical protein|tara:strand:+ start:498 stop:740 length:243 start_codon:yes stop_codon:yes gene_type:complete
MNGKIVSLQEFDSIHDEIMEGEGIPKSSDNGYICTRYLGDYYLYKHPTQDKYYIPQDSVTSKYCSGFVELTSDWFIEEEF